MSLITYVEPTNLGEMFVGIAGAAIILTLAWVIYRFYNKLAQYFDTVVNRAVKYELLEEIYLNKAAEKKGYDLEKELFKRKVLSETPKSAKQKVQDEMIRDMFGEDNAKPKK